MKNTTKLVLGVALACTLGIGAALAVPSVSNSVYRNAATIFKAVADAAAPSVAVSSGSFTPGISDTYGRHMVQTMHPNHVACQVAVSTATTLSAVGGSCVAPGAGLSLYLTDIDFSTNAAGIAADSFNTLKTGTGGTCGTATAVVWQGFSTAATQATVSAHLATPIKLPANSELCWINSTAGSKALNVEGFIAP